MKLQEVLDMDIDLKGFSKSLEEPAKPTTYDVILFNDDYSHADFVADLLSKFFNKDHRSAYNIMLEVHEKGSGLVGRYPKDIAITKVAKAMDYASANGHPTLLKALKS